MFSRLRQPVLHAVVLPLSRAYIEALASRKYPRAVPDSTADAKRAILDLLSQRDDGKTICPSDAARALKPDGFRELMPVVRDAARELVADGKVEVTQGGKVVNLDQARGAIRLRLR
jgi:hypothetical protein